MSSLFRPKRTTKRQPDRQVPTDTRAGHTLRPPSYILLLAAQDFKSPVRSGTNVHSAHASALLAYALVSRAWACVALPLLYRSIAVPILKADQLATLTCALSSYGEWVRELSVEEWKPSRRVVESHTGSSRAKGRLASILSTARRNPVKASTIDNSDPAESVDVAIACLALCRNVRRLSLEGQHCPSLVKLEALLECLRDAERLEEFECRFSDNNGPFVRPWLGDVRLLLECMPYLTALSFYGKMLLAEASSPFPPLENLTSLTLYHVDLRTNSLSAILSNQTNLQHLHIECATYSTVRLSHVFDELKSACTSLVSLSLFLSLTGNSSFNHVIPDHALSSFHRLASFAIRSSPRLPCFTEAVFNHLPVHLRRFRSGAPLWNLTADKLASHVATLLLSSESKWRIDIGADIGTWGDDVHLRDVCESRGLILRSQGPSWNERVEIYEP